MKVQFTALLSLTFLMALCPAGDWPKFRGPTGDGNARVKSLPLKWSATGNVRWKVSVPGKGWSSPVLAGGRIYLTTAVAAGNDQDANGADQVKIIEHQGSGDRPDSQREEQRAAEGQQQPGSQPK